MRSALVSVHGLKKELYSYVTCLFRFMDFIKFSASDIAFLAF